MAKSTTARVANYTPEMTQLIVEDYTNGVSVEDIAAKVVKSVRSVRSKLVREGVYVAKPKVVSRKVEGPTKKELLVELSTTGYDVSGLEGATKDAIARLMDRTRVIVERTALPRREWATVRSLFACVNTTGG